jgi:hypothetical protein
VKTRTLLLLAFGCGLAILVAGGVLLWQLSSQPESTDVLAAGVDGAAGDVVVRLHGVQRAGDDVVVTMVLSGVDDPNGFDDFRLALAGSAIPAQPEGCAGFTVAEQVCDLRFATEGVSSSGGLLVLQRGEDTLRWRL